MYAVILGQIIAVTEETNWQARTIHGGRSAEMIELRREMAILRRAARRTIAAVW